MAMAGLATKNLRQRVSSSTLLNPETRNRRVAAPQQQRWDSGALRRFSSTTSEKGSDEKLSEGQEVAVLEEGSKKFKLFTSRPRREIWRRSLWRNGNRDLSPFSLHELKEEEGLDDEHWSSTSCGYFKTFLPMPEDAKVDAIKAEMHNGVLTITIPRREKPKKDVKEATIQ